MYAGHARAAGWELMWHGNVFLQFINESAEEHRGAHQTGSINWVMGMARRQAGAGHVGVRTMLSLEPWTIATAAIPTCSRQVKCATATPFTIASTRTTCSWRSRSSTSGR
jgi:hypothetical protein